jgi:hypothetical protein
MGSLRVDREGVVYSLKEWKNIALSKDKRTILPLVAENNTGSGKASSLASPSLQYAYITHHKDGGNMFLRSVGIRLQDNVMSQSGRSQPYNSVNTGNPMNQLTKVLNSSHLNYP